MAERRNIVFLEIDDYTCMRYLAVETSLYHWPRAWQQDCQSLALRWRGDDV
jgi:hypothetical protein